MPYLSNAETTVFQLTPEAVEIACLYCALEGYGVSIKLKEPYKTELADLTESLIGQRLKVIFNEETVVEANIKWRINSGRMSARFADLSTAKDLICRLMPGIAEKDIGPCNDRLWPCENGVKK